MSPQAHWYELTLKKGETLIELTADDAAFMQGQLNHWLSVLAVPGVPTGAPLPSPTEAPQPPPPAEPVGLAEHHTTETTDPAPTAETIREETPEPTLGTKNDNPHIALPGGSEVDTTLTQPASPPPATEAPAPSSGFSRPSMARQPSPSTVRHTQLPDDITDAPRPELDDTDELPASSTDANISNGGLDAEASQALDDLLGSPAGGKSGMGLDSVDDESSTARVKPHLQHNTSPKETTTASISDRGKDEETDDDFERVMSNLMADLQGSPVSDEAASTPPQHPVPAPDAIEDALMANDKPDHAAMATPEATPTHNSGWQEIAPETTSDTDLVATEEETPAPQQTTESPLNGPYSEPLDAPLGRPKNQPSSAGAWAPVTPSNDTNALDRDNTPHEPENDTTNTVSAHDTFMTVCETTGAATPEDHLLISAYVLTVHAKQGRFSLSSLNQTITEANEGPVNHSVLETALNKGLLMMVPDLTGTAETTEFELTPHGRTTVETFL